MELDQKRESDQRRRRKEVRAGKAEPNPVTRSHRDSLGLPHVSPGTYPVSELQRGKEELLQALAHPPHDYKSQSWVNPQPRIMCIQGLRHLDQSPLLSQDH